jgi:hypothetical protein
MCKAQGRHAPRTFFQTTFFSTGCGRYSCAVNVGNRKFRTCSSSSRKVSGLTPTAVFALACGMLFVGFSTFRQVSGEFSPLLHVAFTATCWQRSPTGECAIHIYRCCLGIVPKVLECKHLYHLNTIALLHERSSLQGMSSHTHVVTCDTSAAGRWTVLV